jgi:hydroxylaminobenzene mutase
MERGKGFLVKERSRRLIWNGFFLVLLGMLSGFIIPWMSNPKMGISTHLDGLLNGCLLAVIGLVLPASSLSLKLQRSTFWFSLLGAYLGWGATLLAALWGTRFGASVNPGAGGAPWQEAVVGTGFVLAVIGLISAVLILLWGLRIKSR